MLDIDELKYECHQPFLEYIKGGVFSVIGYDGFMSYYLDGKSIFYYSPSEKKLRLYTFFWYNLFHLYEDNRRSPWGHVPSQEFVKFLFKRTFDFKITSVE